jgi:hypothetical protein
MWGGRVPQALAGGASGGDPVAAKAERAKKIAERMEKHREAHVLQQLARKRRGEVKKGGADNPPGPPANLGGSGNGLGST